MSQTLDRSTNTQHKWCFHNTRHYVFCTLRINTCGFYAVNRSRRNCEFMLCLINFSIGMEIRRLSPCKFELHTIRILYDQKQKVAITQLCFGRLGVQKAFLQERWIRDALRMITFIILKSGGWGKGLDTLVWKQRIQPIMHANISYLYT